MKDIKKYHKEIMHKYVMDKNIKICVCKTKYFYDLIAIGCKKDLQFIKKQFHTDSIPIENNILSDKPLIVIDTFDTYRDVKKVYNNIGRMLKK